MDDATLVRADEPRGELTRDLQRGRRPERPVATEHQTERLPVRQRLDHVQQIALVHEVEDGDDRLVMQLARGPEGALGRQERDVPVEAPGDEREGHRRIAGQ